MKPSAGWTVTGVIVGVAASLAAWQLRAARLDRAAAAELAQARVSLEARIQAAQARLESFRRAESGAPAAFDELPTARNRPKPPALVEKNGTPSPDAATLMAKDPELRTLFKRSFQAQLALRFRLFYQEAGLSSEQMARFQDLITEEEYERMDVLSAAGALGLAASDPAVATLRQQQREKWQAAQAQLLGEAGYRQLQYFGRLAPLEGFLGDTAALVADTSEPITLAQGWRLVAALAQANAKYQAGGKADIWSIDWPNALAQAQTFLTPAQLAAVEANAKKIRVFALAVRFYQQEGVVK